MTTQSLKHDVAWGGARACLNVVAGLLREDEHRDAAEEFYRIILEQLASYDQKREQRAKRIQPS